MMAHVVRPLIQWTRWRPLHSTTFCHLLRLHSSAARATTNPPLLAFFSTSRREVHFQSRALKSQDVAAISDANETEDEASEISEIKKSRNERKREAQRALRWGMELANFSPPQIKRILRVADLEQEVFDALMVVKRLGRDVREGKRRQFNYIGKLLREVKPELMDGLIQAMKDGDQSKFQDLSRPEILVVDDEEEEEEISEADEEEDTMNVAVVTRWYEGLVNKDVSITNEIYSLREVDFDRQELRQLVKRLHSALDRKGENDKPAVVDARRRLTRFLQVLADQLPVE